MNSTVLALGLPLLAFLTAWPSFAEEEIGVPPDPFAELDDIPEIPDYAREVDRTRGSFVLPAEEGAYVPGSHFAHWHWKAQAKRWGNYHVAIEYVSSQPKLGVQVRVGEVAVLKGYAPRTGGPGKRHPMIVGTAYLPKAGEYPVTLLTGAPSNEPPFEVKAIHFLPAPESEPLGQSIDGTIELPAKTATTYATNLRYEPKEGKDCLGFWTETEDWAEWVFDVSSPGRFRLEVEQGCGEGQGGSEVAVLVNGQTVTFTVQDTGGFQNWKTLDLGTVEIAAEGRNKIAVIPQSKAGKAVMDIRRIVLTPVPAS